MKIFTLLLVVLACFIISCQENQLLAEGDRVMSHCRIQGVINGPFGDLPATGNEVNVRIFTVFRLVE